MDGMNVINRNAGRGRGRGRRNEGPPFGVGRGGPLKRNKNGARVEENNRRQDEARKNAEERFQNAQQKLMAAVKKHMPKEELSSSSDEEIVESDSVLSKVLQNYSRFDNNSQNLGRTHEFLENLLQSNSGTCLICIGSIKKSNQIWNCIECYEFFHLQCIQKWSQDNIFQQKEALRDLPEFQRTNKINWACPKCRHEYEASDIPDRYYCYCGKVENPRFCPWHVPHSCGDTCGKSLQPECGHHCLLLCHPGPCPPCPKTVQTKCYCGKQGPSHQRCSQKFWSCNSKCEKPLICQKHLCEQLCHAGDCPPCSKESVQKCKCGLQQRKQPCSTPIWQCDKVCGKPFKCGFHSCSEICHDGPCGSCPLSQQRTCPCGKSASQLPCTEEIPTCKDTCGKLLECGIHQCEQKCHKDKCGMCLEIVTKICRCGLHKKLLPCSKEYVCESKCKRIRNCFRHPCNRKCCDSTCPPCEKSCGRTLNCGNHKCLSVCHRGECYPCPQMVEVKCRCGETSISVPCGRKKKTKPPECNKPCKIPPDCHHSARLSHPCHNDACPPCRQICGKERENCIHPCPALCHTVVWVKIENQHQPAGPWEVTEPQFKRSHVPCPQCEVPVPVTCLGGHEESLMPCYQAKPTSCGRRCGRTLKCRNHKCDLPCHEVSQAEEPDLAGKECSVCESECLKKKPGCNHRCTKPCHPGPCPSCTVEVKAKCHCSIILLFVKCVELRGADAKTKEKLLCCQNPCPKTYPCGHKCKDVCHSGDCPGAESCKKKVKIPCKCGRMKKDFTCDIIRNSEITSVDCDEVCIAKKQEIEKAKALEEEIKRQEEERKNKEELEKFQRKFEGKKKVRERNRAKEPENKSSFLSYYRIIVVSVIVGFLATILYLTIQ